MDGRRTRFGVLVVIALCVLSALASPAQAHPYHLEVANEAIVAADSVGLNQWVAQSFTVTSTFRVTRVGLYIADAGASDVLGVSVRSDSAGWPSATNLTQGSVDVGSGGAWADIDLSPWLDLLAGRTYWIVAESVAAGGQGYRWWNSGGESAYLGGQGADSADGATWSAHGSDLAFRVYGFPQPSLSFAASVSNTNLGPGDQTVFRVDVVNSGGGDAAFVWVNVTLPPVLAYVSDDAASVGGVRSGVSDFTFAGVAPGILSFNLTASVNGGVPNGTVASTSFAFDSTDHNGVPQTRATRAVPVTLRNARLSMSLVPNASFADPGDLVTFNATATNTGLAPAGSPELAGTVDPGVLFLSSSPGTTFDPGTRTVRRPVPLLGIGESASMEWTVRVPVGTLDGTAVLSDAWASYRDPSGAAMANETTAALVTVRAPSFSIGLGADRGDAEKADLVVVTLDYTNLGSGTALRAWANWTLAGSYALSALTPAVPYASSPDGFDIALADVPPGVHVLVARLAVTRGLSDGLPMPVQVRWIATDGNGNLLAPTAVSVSVGLRAPVLTVSAASATSNAVIDAVFGVSVTLRNTGRAVADGWLNVTLPLGVEYAGDNGTFASAVQGSNVTWRFSIPAGGTVVLGVNLRGRQAVSGTIRFSVDYADGKGTPPVHLVSESLSVSVVLGPELLSGWAWIALGISLIAGVLGAVGLWRRRGQGAFVEDVFVSDRAGLLLAHRSTTIIPYEDEDAVVGMFEVVQSFVKDAFSKGRDEIMHTMKFGERTVLIERGPHHVLSVVYRGRDRGEVANQVRRVSRQIDETYGETIADWRGDMDDVRGIALLLPGVWTGKPREGLDP